MGHADKLPPEEAHHRTLAAQARYREAHRDSKAEWQRYKAHHPEIGTHVRRDIDWTDPAARRAYYRVAARRRRATGGREGDNAAAKARRAAGHVNRELEHRNQHAQRSRGKARAFAYLGGACVACGTSETLEFDHIDPSTKVESISRLYAVAWTKLMVELDKCQLLCHSHHRLKTDAEKRASDAYARGWATRRTRLSLEP